MLVHLSHRPPVIEGEGVDVEGDASLTLRRQHDADLGAVHRHGEQRVGRAGPRSRGEHLGLHRQVGDAAGQRQCRRDESFDAVLGGVVDVAAARPDVGVAAHYIDTDLMVVAVAVRCGRLVGEQVEAAGVGLDLPQHHAEVGGVDE